MRPRQRWWLIGAGLAGVAVVGTVVSLATSSGRPAKSRSSPATTGRPVATTRPRPSPIVAKEIQAQAGAYVTAAWCQPLAEAAGKSLAVLERDVAATMSGYGALSLTGPLAPSLGQVKLQPAVAPSPGIDMATADAIVPAGLVVPSRLRLVTPWCYGAPQPVAPYMASASGGWDTVDFEVSYGLGGGSRTLWWHVWWQATLSFSHCGRLVCLQGRLPTTPLLYWAVPERAVRPSYVVPGPDGTWRLMWPPAREAAARHGNLSSGVGTKT